MNRIHMRGIDLSDESIYNVYDLAIEHFKSGRFVELGSLYGGSTIYLADKIKKSGKDIELYAIDTWRNIWQATDEENIFHIFWQNVKDHGVEKIIIPICLDTTCAASGFSDQSVDFVFVDADHSYEGCKKDIYAWLPKLKYNGWLGGHDYNQDVEKVVREIFIRDPMIFEEGTRSFLFKEITEYRVQIHG